MATLKVRIQKDLYQYLLQKAKASGFKNIQRMFLYLYNNSSNYSTHNLYSLRQSEAIILMERTEINHLISVLTGVKANCKNIKQLLINDTERFDILEKIQIALELIIIQLRDILQYPFLEMTQLKMLKSVNQTIITKEQYLFIRFDQGTEQRLIDHAMHNNKTKSLIFFETLLCSKAFELDLKTIEKQLLAESQKLELFKQSFRNMLNQHSFTIDNINSISKEFYSKKMKKEDTQSTLHRTQSTMKYLATLLKDLQEFILTNIRHDH